MKNINLSILALVFVSNIPAANLFGQDEHSILVNGNTRSYWLYKPDGITNAPLVLILHGIGGNGEGMMHMTGFNDIAENEGFIAVYPQGDQNTWDYLGDTDVEFISALLDTLNSDYTINQDRIYVCGFSVGGMMSHRLACCMGDQFAAIASVAGLCDIYHCPFTQPIGILNIHGMDDETAPYENMETTIDFWVDHNECSTHPIVADPYPPGNTDSTYFKESFISQTTDTEVVLITGREDQHVWPMSVSGGINASEEIWHFFTRHIIDGFTTITVTTPNGGENWKTGSNHNITWTSQRVGSTDKNITIDYSTNAGNSWNEIVTLTDNDGSYSWTIPDKLSDRCLVRIYDTNDYPCDISDAVFSISTSSSVPPEITVTSPNGGETWQAGSIHDITWDSQNTSGNVKIDYSVDNGSSWTEEVVSAADIGSYSWTVPEASSDNCLIRVSDTNEKLADSSDTVFSIVPESSVSLNRNWDNAFSMNIKTRAHHVIVLNYTIPGKTRILVHILDINGRIIQEIAEEKAPGTYSESITLAGLPKGMYLIRMVAENYGFQTKKIMLLQ